MPVPVAAGPPTPASHRLVTLGGAGLYDLSHGTQLLGPGKPLALLTYLALSPGRRASREFLVDLLWADLDPDRGRAALRQILFHLRRLLGEDALPGSEELTLRHPLASDRDVFLSAMEEGDLPGAIEAYRGAFLPDFGIPGGVAFEHWADLERVRLESAFLRAAELQARRLVNESRFRDAQRLARRARDEAPANEATWRLLLETIIAGQDFVAAAVEASALEQWAAIEGVTLEPATTAALARARQVAPEVAADSRTPGLVTDLIGREREFALIIATWEAARRGPARHLHLSAPAGLGKTRLLRDAAARIRADGAVVVEVRASPGEREIPYALAGDLAAGLAALPGAMGVSPASAGALVALHASLSSRWQVAADPAVGDEALRRRMQAMIDLLQAVSDEQPIALLLDDLHWGDAASLRLLDGLLSRLGSTPVLVVSAARHEYQPVGEGRQVLPLPPLDAPALAEMVRGVALVPGGAAWLDALVSGLVAATRGSPLLVLETLRLALDEGVLEIHSGTWRCANPQRLAELLEAGQAMRRRILALPERDRWFLALLAIAGAPLSLDLLSHTGAEPATRTAAVMATLERAGLVARAGESWQVSHDEIADAVRRQLTAADMARAHAMLGEQLLQQPGADRGALLRAMRHVTEGGQTEALRAAFRRYVRTSREEGDRRSTRALAAEVLGAGAEGPRVRTLVASLPVTWRVGLWSRARQGVAAAVALLVVAGTVGARQVSEARAAALQRLIYADSAGVTTGVIARRAEWDGRRDEVVPGRVRSTMAGPAADFREYAPALSPDGRSVAWNRHHPDSTIIDIWLRTPRGERRLTTALRDDLVISWLPDGSGLAGMSMRWNPPGGPGYDIAVFDTATGAARQVTRGPDHDRTPFVSPDGSRIAFLRERVEGPHLACLTSFDGAEEPECRLPGGEQLMRLHGWVDPDNLLLTVTQGASAILARYTWSTGAMTTLLAGTAGLAELSPDRRWVVVAARMPGVSGTTHWVFPVHQPGEARRVVGVPATGEALMWWEGRAAAQELVDRLEFVDSLPRVQLGVGTRLAVRAVARDGRELPLSTRLRWRAGDTTVAAVDQDGVVHARRAGAVEITASLGGWRTVAQRIMVTGAASRTVERERWDEDWRTRWITFGAPPPDVISGPGGTRGFWNRGDGVYISTAVLRQSFVPRDGLGLEILMHTPVTTSGHQRARVVLVPGLDTLALVRAAPEGPPPPLGVPDAGCLVAFPGGVGSADQHTLTLRAGGTMAPAMSLSVGGDVASGGWWRMRLQVLPDGRCGVAINGRVVWLSEVGIPLDRPLWLRLGDASQGTELLHGPLEVWTGVRTDINWVARRSP